MTDYPPISIRIPLETPSVNAWHGAHWRRYRVHFNRWFAHLRAKLPPRRVGPGCLIHGRIIAYRGRTLDYANLVGGCKMINDSLKRLGYIDDDAPRALIMGYAQHLAPPADRSTLIQLWSASA